MYCEFVVGFASGFFENVLDCSRDNTAIAVAFCSTGDGERFTGTRLTVCEDGAVVSFKDAVCYFN